MNRILHTVEEVSGHLQVNPRTVLRLIHDGHLRATKIGRQWRIADEALRDLTGPMANREAADPASLTGLESQLTSTSIDGEVTNVQASSVIDVQPIGREQADRIAASLTAGLRGRQPGGEAARFDYLYDPGARQARLIVWGNPKLMREVFIMVDHLTTATKDT